MLDVSLFAPMPGEIVNDLVREAAKGSLPPWAVAGPERREHMSRVADLLGSWSEALGLEGDEVERWRAVGHLHDALRDEEPDVLRSRVPLDLRGLPDLLLHGPAAAERLRIDGVLDGELLRAVAFHTAGHPHFGRLGRALYAADFVEPGRDFAHEWRRELRDRLPGALDEVVLEILRARVKHLLDRGGTVLPVTIEFWNALVAEAA